MDSGNLVLILLGLVVGGVGVARAWRVLRMHRGGVRTVGTVIGLEKRRDEDVMFFAPVVAYVDVDGRKREFTMGMRTARPMHRIGDEVPVLYLTGRPGSAWLNSGRHNLTELGILLGAGALNILAGLLL